VRPVTGERALDVVVFGASGFTGRLVADYLARQAPAGARIGLAGRSAERLAAVRSGLGAAAADWPLLFADSDDSASLAELAGGTRVVATTVGPYAKYGLPLVRACAEAGTDYVDLTGEVLFMRDSIDRYDTVAAAGGARIVHACGFDSIPSDLGVLVLHEAVAAAGDGDLEDTTLVVTRMKGGFSGGTVASVSGQVEEMLADVSRRRLVTDPYALSPDRAAEPDLGPERDLLLVERHAELGWLAPFVMAGVNSRVVRRSNALADWAYGRRFRYREAIGCGSGMAAPALAAAVAAGTGTLLALNAVPPTRALLHRLLPSPGEGPDERARRSGHFRIEIHTRTSTGARWTAEVAGRGDPGYAATSVMLAESALCLALDADRVPPAAGVLTPATAMGMPLVDRLRAAGLTFAATLTG